MLAALIRKAAPMAPAALEPVALAAVPARAQVAAATVAANDATSFRWRAGVDGRDFEVRTLPEATAADMLALYPGATIEPLPDDDGESGVSAIDTQAGEPAGGTARVADDRRYCADCAHLAARPDRDGARRCYAGERGNLAHGSRRYYPVTEFPRRCEAYRPLPGDPDQRTGAERWPGLSDDSARQEYGR